MGLAVCRKAGKRWATAGLSPKIRSIGEASGWVNSVVLINDAARVI
jgi:hypothetical protein